MRLDASLEIEPKLDELRAVETPDHGYVMLCTEWNRKMPRLAAATSRDLVHWEKRGPVFAGAGDHSSE